MPRKRPYRAITSIDPAALAAFQAEIRRRYSDEEILEQLRACAAAARALADDEGVRATTSETRVHPQTVIEHFGSWNKAKRRAGLVPRRFATREELLGLLQELGEGSAVCRPRRTSTRTGAGCRRSRSTGTRSGR